MGSALRRSAATALVATFIAGSFSSRTDASVVLGPVSNGGHQYYLVSKNSWTSAEAEAQTLGGHLATVNTVAENTFLVNTFVLSGHSTDPLWLGFNDAATEGLFKWASGEAVTYTNWNPGEPNDNFSNEDYAALNWDFAQGDSLTHADWNDTANVGTSGSGGTTDGPYFGIVEVAPEPGSFAVLGCAAAAALGRRRWRRTRGR